MPLLILASLGVLFYREFVLVYAILRYQPKPPLAQAPTQDRFWFSKSIRGGLMILNDLFGRHLFVEEKLWDLWTQAEREAVAHWARAVTKRFALWRRLLGWIDVHLADRDAILLGAKSMELCSAIEKADRYLRESRKAEASISILNGLGLTGHSPLRAWPTPEQRAQHLSRHQSRLHVV